MEPSEDHAKFAEILFKHTPGGQSSDESQSFLFDPEQLSYLTRLGSQGLESLNGEVARLNEELAIVEHQTRDMASQNYQIFVQSAQTTNLIKFSLDEGIKSVTQLSDTIFPKMKTSATEFCTSPCNDFSASMKGIESLFEKESDLTLALDMPWIVRKCLAEERLPDAIKILQKVQDWQKNETSEPVALKKTCDEVMELKSEIQHALLSKLSSGNIGLSECLQTVSLLRSFFPDDKALRFRYLQSRMKDVHFEQSRAWMFDTLTQHRAAFGGDSNHYLSTWVALQMNRILADMQKNLDQGSSIDSLMTNATYFGESLARVGSDMRGLIVPIFSDHLVKRLSHDLTQSEIQFVRNLHQFNLSTTSFTNADSANLDMPSDLTPPKQLITHTPLATYLNDVLNLLNLVGKCPLTQSAPQIVQRINESVKRIGNEIVSWGNSEWLTWELREQTEFNRMKRYFEHLLVPHIDKVVRVVFPPVNISVVTGTGVTKCAKLCQVNYTISESETVGA